MWISSVADVAWGGFRTTIGAATTTLLARVIGTGGAVP
jgi:hypothetical protein